MTRILQTGLILIIFLFLTGQTHAQFDTAEKEFNELYQPVKVIQRLSYDNFKKIKLLHTSIMNYGGGDAEFDKLVSTYAEASALYFQKKIIESANLFTKNEKEIDQLAMKIAKRYKDDTDKLHIQVIKTNVNYNIKRDLEKKERNPYNDKTLIAASEMLQQAEDFYVRSMPIDAIKYYRLTKDQCFKLYEILKEPVPDQYKRDRADNQNQVYVEKEKKI